MESIVNNEMVSRGYHKTKDCRFTVTNLSNATINEQYTIKEVKTSDDELKNFLFTLGCYGGEKVTVISDLAENYVILVKDARYSIDKELAEAIVI